MDRIKRDVVRVLCQPGQQFRQHHSGLPASSKLEWTAEPRSGLLRVNRVDESLAGSLSVAALQLRLGIEQIHLAGPAVLKQQQYPLGSRRKVRLLRQHVIARGPEPSAPDSGGSSDASASPGSPMLSRDNTSRRDSNCRMGVLIT